MITTQLLHALAALAFAWHPATAPTPPWVHHAHLHHGHYAAIPAPWLNGTGSGPGVVR